MAGEHAPRQQGRFGDSPASIGFVLGDQTATQLPLMEGSRAARFHNHAAEKTVGGAHAVAVMTGEQTAQRSSDDVVSVLLPRPQRIKAANGVVFSRANCVLGWFGKGNIADAFLRGLQCFAVIGFEQNDALPVAQDESGTSVGTLPFDAIGTIFCDGGLMDGLAFLQPGANVAAGGICRIPRGSPEQKPVPIGPLAQCNMVAIPTTCKVQAAIQILKLAAEQSGQAGFAHAIEADLPPISGQGFG